MTNQWINSYKRLAGWGMEARVISAGATTTVLLVRVPMYKPAKASRPGGVRSLDSATNPYLAYALILAAGLKGIEEKYELPAATEDDVWALSEERRAMGLQPLPGSLEQAIAAMEGSEPSRRPR